MLFIIGAVVVIGCVFGGYAIHGGNLLVLWQPSELMIIGGAAVGSFIIGNPMKRIKHVGKSMGKLFKGAPTSKESYIELLTLMFTVFKMIKTKGMLEIETHIEKPHESSLFQNYPKFLHNHHAVTFFCDYLRLMTMGMEDHYQMEDLMDRDLEEIKKDGHESAHAVINMADAMPALGIVAAVLGVIITMGSITEPPEILGHLIGAALVGTFLGVLLSYGFVAPMGRSIGAYYDAEDKYIEVIKNGLLAHLKGNAPVVTVEFARGTISPQCKPSFQEVEEALNNIPQAGAPQLQKAA